MDLIYNDLRGGAKVSEESSNIGVAITPELKLKLIRTSNELNASISSIVREALKEYFGIVEKKTDRLQCRKQLGNILTYSLKIKKLASEIEQAVFEIQATTKAIMDDFDFDY